VFTAGTKLAHDTVTGAGQVITGAILSLTVIIWLQVALLPHTSVDLYVLVIVNLFAQLPDTVTSLTNVTVGTPPPQLSDTITLAVFTGGTNEAQETVTGAGHVILGAIISFTVITWVQVELLPHTSVARYVLVTTNLFTHGPEVITSFTKVTVTVPPQLSLVTTKLVFGAGTSVEHDTVIGAGHVILGAVKSLITKV